eukprot:CAMPEP_0114357348 /NCGR_PEP_ID=MMETSP0101-20121206/21558_1 /TAXON_ID=38822 ORGANISM="Pteridomonas danica, Strain PT" /NCGR_SAMPLE_ID=MMETSP0101 /ASSEMBLY_ACC=CAM_ASM_000211 /LENGTH=375 /DNA_ID=CAMNT_0001500063 /DNA_START=433 /DNA_END=1557 /DNA_ORIENTATION=+
MASSSQNTSSKKMKMKKKVLFKQYELNPKLIIMDKKIGAGAFGEVFKGSFNGNTVAIKTMINVTEKTAKLFRAEILLTATLKHPNIVNFIGTCWGRELTCLVLEWVPKGTLGDLLESESQHELTWLDPLHKMAIDMAQGLNYLHSIVKEEEEEEEEEEENENDDDVTNKEAGKGKRESSSKHCILHRDMKPDNVLITEFLSCKITDFGTSRAKEANANITMSAVGTPLFCAPEIVRGEVYDESVDDDHHKKTVPKQPMRFIRSMTEHGWRPITITKNNNNNNDDDHNTSHNKGKEEDGVDVEVNVEVDVEDEFPDTPKSILALIIICLSHDSKKRPSFHSILSILHGPCADEIRNKKTFLLSKFEKNRLINDILL